MKKRKSLTIEIDAETLRQAKSQAVLNGESLREIVERALAEYIKTKEVKS